MSASTGPRALGLVIAAVIAVLVTGCGGAKTPSPTPSGGTTSSTPASLTTADLAWIQAIPEMHKKIDKPFMANNMMMTRAKMGELEDSLRFCKRELTRLGVPGDPLLPAYDLVKQACRTYTKGARCFATAAHVSDVSGGTVVGTPEARIQRRALACGFAAEGNGSNLMSEAESKATEIQAQYP
jgi:hypothetical protein